MSLLSANEQEMRGVAGRFPQFSLRAMCLPGFDSSTEATGWRLSGEVFPGFSHLQRGDRLRLSGNVFETRFD